MGPVQIYCLDTSQCAALNEDFPGSSGGCSRLAFQRLLSQALLSQALLAAGPATAATASSDVPEVALVASYGGKATVVLPPGGRAGLLPALDRLPNGGACSVGASLRLGLLLARRFPAAHVTAFLASPCQLPPTEALELRGRLGQAGGAVTLDVVLLAPREELEESALEGLSCLADTEVAAGPQSPSEPQSASSGAGIGDAPAEAGAGAGVCRLVWVGPHSVPREGEGWQQLEAVLELLERRGEEGGPSLAPAAADGGAVGGAAGGHSPAAPPSTPSNSSRSRGAPAHIRRGPRLGGGAGAGGLRRPTVPLLASRSGVYQPALCRHECLDWLGHLSSDGMARPGLPNYAALGARERQRTAGQRRPGPGRSGVAGAGEHCFLQVCPIPKWRTLLRISAGLLRPATDAGEELPAAAAAAPAMRGHMGGGRGTSSSSSSSSSSAFASLSRMLLSGLEALQLDSRIDEDEEEEAGDGAARGARAPVSTASVPAAAAPPDAHASMSPDGGAAAASGAGAVGDGDGAACEPAQLVADGRRGTLRLLQAVKEPSMLKLTWSPHESAAAGSPSGAAGAALASAEPAQQPFHMFEPQPGRAQAAAGSRTAPWGAPPASGGSEPPSAPAAANQPIAHHGVEYWESGATFAVEVPLGPGEASAISGRALPNGAQLLLLPGAGGGRAPGALQRRRCAAAGFWLQQHWRAECCCLPAAAATGGSAMPASSSGGGSGCRNGGALEVDGAASSALAAAAALAWLLASPPAVNLRQLRRDVKAGALKVTPVSVGPLPARLVQHLLSTRASIMQHMGVENLDDRLRGGEARGDSGGSSAGADGGGKSSGGGDDGSGRAPDASGGDAGSRGHAACQGEAVGVGQEGSSRGGGDEASSKRRRGVEARGPAAAAAGVGWAGWAGGALLREEEPSGGAGQSCLGAQAQQLCARQGPGEGGGCAEAAAPMPCPPALHAAPAGGEASMGSTPYGTPMHIVPSRLAEGSGTGRIGEGAEGACGAAGSAHCEPGAAVAEEGVVEGSPCQESRDDSVLFELD